MSRYNYNTGNYYDPVGSQQNQPTGYTYGGTPTTSAASYPSAATTSYQSTAPNSAAYQGYQYNQQQQQYGTSGQASSGSTNRTANTMSNMSGQQDYNQQASNTAGSNNYEGSSWGTASYDPYNSGLQLPNRTQQNASPLYATQASSNTFGGQSGQSTQGYNTSSYQSSRQTATPSTQSYQQGYTQPAQTQSQQPQRYNSPLHAVQAQQQSHNKQASRGSNHQPSPRMQAVQQAGRQQSASVEPAPTTMTVNPSQVYDDRAERQRKAQIEAEKRRKREEEAAARKAEEERIAVEKRKAEEEKQKAEKEAAMKKAEADRKAEDRKKARAEKRQSKSAAAALQKMASSGGFGDMEGPPANDEEAEMRAMFKKMREFNARNPAMLAKLWEEERKTHNSSQSPQATKSTPAAATAPPPPAPQQNTPAVASSSSSSAVRPFQKPAPPQPKPAPTSATKPTTPINAQASTQLWPPQKKGTLAEAAALWLSRLPQNIGKIVTKDDILRILESNPSYVQLCEALESKNLKFERSALARELLKAVPDGMKAQVSQQQQPPALGTVAGTVPQVNGSPDTPKKNKGGRPKKDASKQDTSKSTTVEYDTPSFTSLSDVAREIYAPPPGFGGPVQPPQAPAPPAYMAPSAPMGSQRAPSQSQPPEVKPEVKPEEPRPPPANKEEAARKRTFGDLVDLTAQDSDDDDGPPPMKKMFQMPSVSQAPPQQHGPPTAQMGSQSFSQPMNANDFYKRPTPNTPGQGSVHPSVPWHAAAQPPQRPGSAAQPAGPLPPPQQPKPFKAKGPSLERQQQERIRGKMLAEPIMRDRVARKSRYDPRTIARDVLLATGRHPDMRPLNSHLNTMAKLLGDHGGSYEDEGGRGNRADLSTIRWDIIDPEPAAKPEVKNAVEATTAGGDVGADADDEDDTPEPTRVVQRAVDNGDGTVNYISVHEQLTGKPKIKRRGRPPRHSVPGSLTLTNGAGERVSSITLPLSGGHGTATPARQTQTPAKQTPASAPQAGGSVGYAAFRQYDERGKQIKKKGRPFGWRKAVHSKEAHGLPPATNPSAKKVGRPLGSGTKESKVVEPKYQVWKCKWEGCGAELHNLDTLKKHVVKLHGRPNAERVFECLWEGCEDGHGAAGGKGKGRAGEEHDGEVVATFPDQQRWLQHVDPRHLRPVAWELGDGPRGGTAGDYNNATDSEAYLSDAQGRSVTPIVVPDFNRPEATSRVLPSALRKPGRAAKGTAHMSKEERQAAAELEELEKRKRVVGFTMEKTGATFVNKKRELGFLNDEDFEDEVDSEGVHASSDDDEEAEAEADEQGT